MTVPVSFLLRVGLLAGAGIVGSLWALVRYYTHPPIPMRVTVAIDAGTWDAGAGLIEAPDLETLSPH